MKKRFLAIWFRHLTTDWLTLRRPELKEKPFVFAVPDHGRKVITATNRLAEEGDVSAGMVVADAKAILPELEVIDDVPGRDIRLLRKLAEWCIRYTPITAVEPPDGLTLDASGCMHLWGGERAYFKEVVTRLQSKGYDVRAAIADTPGAAWAVARFGKVTPLIAAGGQTHALLNLPPAALRLEIWACAASAPW
jgi:protein ImuB